MPKSLVPKIVTKQSGVPEEGQRTEDTLSARTCPPEGRLPCSHLCANNSSSSSQLCINSSSNQLIVNSSQLGPGYLTLPRSKVMSDNILLTSPKTKVRGYFPIFQCKGFIFRFFLREQQKARKTKLFPLGLDPPSSIAR
jgi:hypothetical protein